MAMAGATLTADEMTDLLRRTVDRATVRAVFGDPVTEGGVTLVPVAKVQGGGGGGGGEAPPAGDATATAGSAGAPARPGGAGAGIGLSARPLGVYVVRDGQVTWRPAVDVNRVVLGGQIVAVVALLTVRALVRHRARRQHR
jgi:uncharacterized spore protein YtfJ